MHNEYGYFTTTTTTLLATSARDHNNNAGSDDECENIRNMGRLNTSLMRMFLECALYLGSLTESNAVAAVLAHDQPKPASLSRYFYAQLSKTVNRLAAHLNTSPDDSLLFVHFVLNQSMIDSISTTTSSHKSSSTKSVVELKHKKDRTKVEKEFCTFVNEKVLRRDTVEKLIASFTTVLRDEAESSGSNVFFRIAYELVRPPTTAAENNTNESNQATSSSSSVAKHPLEFLNRACMWQFRKQITLETFVNSFNEHWQKLADMSDQQQSYALLKNFLEKLDQLQVNKNNKHFSIF